MPNVSYSDPAVLAFVVIPLALVGAVMWGTAIAWQRSGATRAQSTRTTAIAGAIAMMWLTVCWVLGDSGVLREWDRRPPPLMLLLVVLVAVAVAIAFTSYGRRLVRGVPLWALVGVQGFRLPLELAMHALVDRGIMPEQMSYSGRNFDIVTGITAIVVAALVRAGYGGRRLVAAWNVLGFVLLVNIVVVAVLSTPMFRYFGDDRLNVFVTYTPFVWLPTVMVLAALAGHLLLFRARRNA